MSLFIVDQNLCTKCGICREVCPSTLIELKDGDSFPTPGNEKLCINCGHCAAACPHGALSLDKMPLDRCPPAPRGGEPLLSPEKIDLLYRARRSIRQFKEKPVDGETLNKLIDICRYAPSAHNIQPVRWVVVSNPDTIKQMSAMTIDCFRYLQKKDPSFAKMILADKVIRDYESGIDSVCLNAPHVIFTHVHVKDLQPGRISDPNDLANGVIASTYMQLALASFGLGGCWAGYLNSVLMSWAPLRNVLGIPKSHISTSAILVGYPKYQYYRLPLRNKADITWI
jgi:nitroreductase/NAD-dependent dihydropyrimidine dehydrogenase PreA subunit